MNNNSNNTASFKKPLLDGNAANKSNYNSIVKPEKTEKKADTADANSAAFKQIRLKKVFVTGGDLVGEEEFDESATLREFNENTMKVIT